MSLSALPEWKQLLLERKRREEEDRERREREEEERLASMPAWKRGIIQRRRAKQDEEREREKERDVTDVLGITEDIVSEHTDGKLAHHLQTGYKVQVLSKETISPIQQNPFIRSENSFRREHRAKEVTRDGENEWPKAANKGGRERSRDTEREIWRGRDREMRVEKMGGKSEGRERDRSSGRESREDSGTFPFPPVAGLRTIQANNIIIIEKEKNGKDKLEKMHKEVEEENRMRMDLREFLAGGGSVTEIRASEVLIIKPSVTDGKKETEIARMQERGRGEKRSEREGIWTSMRLTSRAVMQKAERVLNHKDKVTSECSGRVSQLLSKFGEHPKPPMRSKSTDCFNRPGKDRARYSTGDLFEQEEQYMGEAEDSLMFRGVPKRSFSFSDRVVCQHENRECEEKADFKVVERTYSDRRVKTRVTDPSESQSRVTRRWSRPKHDEVMYEKREKERRVVNKRNDSVCGETEQQAVDGEEGFTVACVKNPEEVVFARRIPIKQDERESSSEREIKRVREENEIKVDQEIHRDKRREERETMLRQTPADFQIEAKTDSESQDEVTIAASRQSHGTYIPPSDESIVDFSADIQCQCVHAPTANSSCPSMACARQRQTSGQTVLTQHTKDLLCNIGQDQLDKEFRRTGNVFSHNDTERISDETSNQDQKGHHIAPKQATEEVRFTSKLQQQDVGLGQGKLGSQEGISIPRTVFYGVEVSAEMRRASLPAGEGHMERRGSWKAGRPLTRVESLKEKIRQQEKERQKSKNDDKEADGREAEGTVREQEETTLQTLRLFDVTQDVSMAKSSPQLPVPVSLSLLQSASTEREVGEITKDVSETDLIRLRETERETERHVEACGTCNTWRTQDTDGEEDKREREEELLEEEYLPPSLSPSPPLSGSLDTMSRIYNLKTVGSRTAVCISERTSERTSPHSGLQGKYNPIRQAPSPDVLPETAKLWNHGRDSDKTETMETTGVQKVQRQVERLQLREQEAGCGSHNDRKAQPSMERSPLIEPEVRATEVQKRPDILREMQKSQSPRLPQAQQKVQRAPPKPQQVRSFTINARTEEPTETLSRPPEQSSPSPSSPCTASPSSTPSPPLFSIRSASGGPSKRGTTITITPRRPTGMASSGGAQTATPTAPKTPAQGHASTPAPISNREGKKRYPTAEEIEVIGGYQNLERSCLAKSRGTPKAVKVCFDEAQLERVCEYPSEDCMLASLPCYPHPGPEDGGRGEGWRGGEQEAEGQEEDEEDESAALVSCSDVNVCAGRVRFLKVDESCKRLSK